MKKNLFTTTTAMGCLLMLLHACSDDLSDNGARMGKGVFQVAVIQDWDNQADTRAVSRSPISDHQPVQADGLIGGQTIYLSSTEMEGINAGKSAQPRSSATRGVLVSDVYTSFYSTFGLWEANAAVPANALVSDDSQRSNMWTLSSDVNWPSGGATFFAIAPYSTTAYAGMSNTAAPAFTYTTPATAEEQPDVMVAANVMAQITDATVTFPFRHIMTAVKFKTGATALPSGYKITKIELTGIETVNSYSLATSAWGTATKTGDVSQTYDFATDDAVNSLITNDYTGTTFIVLPQTLPGGAQAVLTVEDMNAHTTLQVKADLAGKTWVPGHTYTYIISTTLDSYEWVITAQSAAPMDYTQATSGNYSIESYKSNDGGITKQPVAWETVKYEFSVYDEATASWTARQNMGTTMPAWIQSLSLTAGSGTTGAAELGTATVDTQYEIVTDRDLAEASVRTDWDLSTHDVKGNATAQNTANCYVISAPGTYKLPLVYGNAIQNGTEVTSGYVSTARAATVDKASADWTGVTRRLWDDNSSFWEIGSASVLRTFRGATADVSDAKIAGAASSSLVWSDISEDILTDAAVTGDYLTFEVKKENIQRGNAVVAVKDATGNVLWSWHLWFASADVLNVPGSRTTAKGDVVKFAQRPLGWYCHEVSVKKLRVYVTVRQIEKTDNQATYIIERNGGVEATDPHCVYYQSGRKDPMPGTDTFYPTTGYKAEQLVYDHAVTASEFANRAYDVLGKMIQHPGTFYYVVTPDGYRKYGKNVDPQVSWQDGSKWVGTNLEGKGSLYPKMFRLLKNLWSANNDLAIVPDYDALDQWENEHFHLKGLYNFPWVAAAAGKADLSKRARTAVVKTIYDPSPAGYHVPAGDAFTAFNRNASMVYYSPSTYDQTDHPIEEGVPGVSGLDVNYSGYTFQLLGSRSADRGLLQSYGKSCNYQTAVPFSWAGRDELDLCWGTFYIGVDHDYDFKVGSQSFKGKGIAYGLGAGHTCGGWAVLPVQE